MSRKIIDSVVEKRNKELQVIEEDQSFYFIYGGNVAVGFPKLKINQIESQGKMKEFPLIYDVIRYYDGIHLSDEPAMLLINDLQCSTFPEVIRILKALFLGQCSKNEEFSIAVSNCAAQLAIMIQNEDAVFPFAYKDDYTQFQKVVSDEVSRFVMEKFDADNIGYEIRTEQPVVEFNEIVDEE